MNFLKTMLHFILIGILLFGVETKITGTHPKQRILYEAENLKCPTTGKQLTPDMINDGFCDCPDDGFDEPGTAACELGKFYCRGRDGKTTQLPSFKVNDGVCDCCDGADEYLNNFGIECTNTCNEAKEASKDQKYLDQLKLKKASNKVMQMKVLALEKQEKLNAKLAEIHVKLEDMKSQTETAEKIDINDRDTVEKFLVEYRKKLDELETLISQFSPKAAALHDESNNENTKEEYTWASTVRGKLGKLKTFLSFFVSKSQKPVTVTKYIPTFVTKTVILQETARPYEDRFNDMDYEQKELENEAQDIQDNINEVGVFGPDMVYLSLKDECFSLDSGQYTYSFCWFKEIRQDGPSSNSLLGKWKKWLSNEDGSPAYRRMLFDEGYFCGATQRETEVELLCGWKNQVISVEEPSMCRYKLKFETPVACLV